MDLAITAYVLAAGAVIVYRSAKTLGRGHPCLGRVLMSAAFAVAVWMAWTLGNSFRWAVWVPLSGVPLIANASVILVIASAGLLVGTHCLGDAPQQLRRERRAVMALCATAVWCIAAAVVRPLWQPIELQAPAEWRDGICLQSHEATCAPAAAATLLARYGIRSTESEMAAACLTSNNGTLALGTFRGLCIGSQGHSVVPQALLCDPQAVPADEVESRLPMLVHVDFHPQSRTTKFLGAIGRRQGHAVVLLKRNSDGSWLVADPAAGHLRWDDHRLRSLWIGEGIYLCSAK